MLAPGRIAGGATLGLRCPLGTRCRVTAQGHPAAAEVRSGGECTVALLLVKRDVRLHGRVLPQVEEYTLAPVVAGAVGLYQLVVRPVRRCSLRADKSHGLALAALAGRGLIHLPLHEPLQVALTHPPTGAVA